MVVTVGPKAEYIYNIIYIYIYPKMDQNGNIHVENTMI